MGQHYAGPAPLQCFFNNGDNFYVALDSANFHEGSTATGKIGFNLTNNCPPITVYITIMGYERVMWRRRVRRGKSTRVVTYRDHALACNQRFVVMQSAQSFLPGQYSYPFTFQVPAGIPGTYGHESGYHSNRAECSVTYMLYAELVLNDVQPGQQGMIGRSMCPIVIMQQARTPYNYNMEANITNKVTTWCCCNKGNVGVNCTFEKDVVRIDEAVTMRFNIDNSNSKIGIKTVKAVLKRKLFLKTNSGLSTYRETNMITLPLPGCDKEQKIDEKIVRFDLSVARDIGTPANLGAALAEFAGKIQQTCNGSLITCQYELHIIAEVDGCVCCENQPFVYAPIEILAPERVLVFQQVVYQVPEGYDPSQGPPPEGQPAYGAPAYGQPAGPAPDGQNPQLQYGAPPGGYQIQPAPQDNGEMPVKPSGTQKLAQKRVDDTPMEQNSEDV
jgi:hypothetical protein